MHNYSCGCDWSCAGVAAVATLATSVGAIVAIPLGSVTHATTVQATRLGGWIAPDHQEAGESW